MAANAADPLTIYSSLPLQGAQRDQTDAIIQGEQLAFEQAQGMAAGQALRYVSLDDSTAAQGNWNPQRVITNAQKAANDPATIGYIGEFNSGASILSIPFLNQAGIAQISPDNTYVGLTRKTGYPGEPSKYYPSGVRTFARLTPNDTVQGAAIIAWMRDEHVKRFVLVSDGDTYGDEIARYAAASAKKAHIAVTRLSPKKATARALRRAKANALLFAGVTANGAATIYKRAHEAHDGWKLYGGDGVCESGLTKNLGAASSTFRCTVATLDLSAYPGGKQFQRDFKAKYGTSHPDPYAIYGYESMRLMLDSINRAAAAGPLTQAAVAQALLTTPSHDSPIGTYAIDQYGDTTSKLYGGYTVGRDHDPTFAKTLDASGL